MKIIVTTMCKYKKQQHYSQFYVAVIHTVYFALILEKDNSKILWEEISRNLLWKRIFA